MILSWLQQLPVRVKLLILVATPSMATVIATQQEFATALERTAEIEQLDRLAQATIAGGELVHELQKERGMSAGFLSSAGRKFTSALPEQRKLTDQKFAAFNLAVTQLGDGVIAPEYEAGVDSALERLARLQAMRGDITALSTATKDAVAYYTGINTELLTNMFRLSHRSSDSDISRTAGVYGNFSSSKERAGIERALFSVTFNLDRFTRANELRILQLINEQDLFLTLFRKTATDAQMQAFEQVTLHEDYVATQRYRDLAFERRENFGVDSETWFATITGKINQLRALEGSLADDLRATVRQKQADANTAVIYLVAASAAFLLVTGVIAFMIIRRMQRDLGAEPGLLIRFADHVAKGNDGELAQAPEDATGVFASMREMQGILVSRASEEQRQARTIGQLMRSLDKISTEVIVTDPLGQVTYVNRAFTAYSAEHSACLAAGAPAFDRAKPVGATVDALLGEPASLDASQPQRVIERQLGERTLTLTLNLVCDEDGQHTATVIELDDITGERRVVDEVAAVIARAASGHLDARVSTDGKTGVILNLSREINNLLQVTEDVAAALAASLGALSKGDLTHTDDRTFDGTFADLTADVANTTDVLRSVVQKIQSTAGSVESASSAISEGAVNLNQRTERAAGVIECTVAQARDLADTVSGNAERTGQASGLVDTAHRAAEEGANVVERAVLAMRSISESSERIFSIIEVINEISFQTNLLALNAAVEAARAGENGRGFAVVANEVRNLASRSTAAAQEIKDIIETSSHEVASGVELVDETGQKLQEIVGGVQSVNAIFGDLAERSATQVQSIASIRSQLESLEEDTRQNAGLVAATSESTQSTMNDVRSLTELIKFFRIEPKPDTREKAVERTLKRLAS